MTAADHRWFWVCHLPGDRLFFFVLFHGFTPEVFCAVFAEKYFTAEKVCVSIVAYATVAKATNFKEAIICS